MNSSDFASKKLKGRDVSAAPLINNYNKSLNAKEEQNGRSMIEMLGVLAIIGVLSVGGIAGYSKAMMKYRINKTIEQITLITGNLRTFFRDKYDDVMCSVGEEDDPNCKIFRKAKLVPEEMMTLNSDGELVAITNAFGGDVDLYPSHKSSYPDYKGFFFDIYDLPQEACIELASYDWRITGITMLGFWTTNDFFAKVPIAVDKAVEYCAEALPPIEMFFVYNADPDSDYWRNSNRLD